MGVIPVKKLLSFLLMVTLLFAGCDSIDQSQLKLVDLEKYSAMTIDGTTSIEVVYDYIEGEFTTYEFVVDDRETIDAIMTEVFNISLKDYPKNQDIDFYQRHIIIHQGNAQYSIDLSYYSDSNGNMYLCQSQGVCYIIEKHIGDNIIK